MADLLTLIAELSVAIAGFTAVFSVLDRRKRSSRDLLQRHRVRQMLILSLVTALSCLLPLWLGALGAEPNVVWGVSGATVSLLAIVFMVYIGRIGRRLVGLPDYSKSNAVFMWSVGMITVGLFICSALLGGALVAPGLYSAALLLALTLALIQFVRAAMKQMEDATADGGTT